MKIICDNCATKYSIADEKVRGKVFKIRCKKCSHIIVVRGQEKVEEAPPQDDVARAFDQKETRVFDYSGFDSGEPGAPGAEAPAGEVPSWHVVIDREQVGPMTVAEVKERYARGEVDAESYAWREGFEDWLRLASVPEFADLFAGTAAAPNPFLAGAAPGGGFPEVEGGVFGSSGIGHSTDVAGDEGADLFGGQAPTTQGFSPEASPVFASAAAPPEPEPAPMFTAPPGSDDEGISLSTGSGGGGGGGMFGAAAAASPRVEVRPMTGQRNENSVLFSLSNLSAMATSAPAKETPKVGLPSTTTEGSGLIDIRSMAQATMSSSKPADGGAIDDIPSFAPSFSPVAAPVLLPTASEGMPKWVWPVIGVGGALVIAIIVMVVMLAGKKPQQITVAPTGVIVQAPTGTAGTPAATGPATPSGASGTAVAMNTPPTNHAAPVAATGAAPATPEKGAKEPKAAPKEPKGREPRAHEPKAAKEPKPAKEPRAHEPKPAKEPAAKPAGKKDELDCLLDPSKCRGGSKPDRGGREKPKADSGGEGKERLEPSDIQRGMRAVKGRVQRCYDQYKVPGLVQVSVTISPSGRVSSTRVSGKFAGTPTGSCVAGAVRGAHFDKFRGGALTITYPFVLR
jgi:predicted Zn finger-like uncharacterized protein